MRIKCPNSDIVLELPGDRTDMKFTCPACHKVHRVTVSITTPGEDPAPTPANAVAKSVPHMPKKYATGAYAPVVDIPIDANFVLVDASSGASQQGIDLGKAAKPAPESILDESLSGRKTEVYNRPYEEKAEPVSPPKANPVDAPDERKPADDQPEKTPPHESAALPKETPRKFESAFDGGSSRPQRQEKSRAFRNILIGLLAVVLAASGYLAWQQVGFDKITKIADDQLAWADSAWEKGDVAAAASDAKKAGATLKEGEAFHTPHALWNRVADATGIVQPWQSPIHERQARIQKHLDREQAIESFRGSLDAMDANAIANHLSEVKPSANGDAQFMHALDKTAADAAITYLEGASDGWTPEAARAHANAQQAVLSPALGETVRNDYENRISSFNDNQRRRLTGQIKREVNRLAVMADAGNGAAIEQYRTLSERIRHIASPELSGSIPLLADKENQVVLTQLDSLSAVVGKAKRLARTVLSHDEEEDVYEVDPLIDEARAFSQPNAKLMDAAVKQIEDTTMVADDLLGLRIELYGRLQAELRRNRENPGTRMAWSMLRSAFDDQEMEIDPSGFKYDSNNAAMVFSIRGLPAKIDLKAADYEEEFRATVAGYQFKTGWANLFHKPLTWMADLAASMRSSGVDPDVYPSWELLEGPGAPLALSLPGVANANAFGLVTAGAPRMIYFNNHLLPVRDLPAPAGSKAYTEDFRNAAVRLEEAVMADESIPSSIRQALKPILQGTHQPPDPRDFFDSAFCRRLIEADYLETYINPMPAAIGQRLREYRDALGKLEAGYDEFSSVLSDGSLLFGVNRLDRDISGAGKANDQDMDTGESIPRLTWRIEKDDETIFFSPQPVRFVYAFMLAEYYPGKHKTRPAGVPSLSEVRHATKGLIASYRTGDATATGDAELWNKAIQEDESGRFDPTTGPPGWNYPLHVLQRDDQGDPVLLATLSGLVDCPDFSRISDLRTRRDAEDEWLDHTAATLASPGELGLIFHQFFRYCSDSPLPELPNLIGSHYGLSDTHQTVYESLERRWVGRFIGDCDDLAEVFQVLTRKQGKLSHVMQLPGHAAAGYVDKIDDNEYRFVLLQTGPVMQFTAASLPEVVEIAYRSFDRGEGMSHMTTDAVPLLLRFADEQTRTPFVLSSRIYADADYAEKMIEVQSYWHEHVYSAALAMMEKMVEEDQEIGNIKELGSLYERVGDYDKSAEMRRRELDMVRNNPQQELSTLLEISQLHFQDHDKEKSLEALGEMEDVMRRLIRMDDAPEFFRAITFRSYWAMMMARLDQPERAWQLVRYDATMTKRQLGRIAEPVLRTMVILYDRMRAQQEAAGGHLPEEQETALEEVRRELDEAFGRGYFKSDDSYNNIINRYFVLGRYAVSDVGREEGLRRLRLDGPYPTAPKDQTRRTRGLDDEDWEWFRITPQLYLALGMEMLDEDEYPELFDPVAARPMLEDVSRAIAKGAGLGSDVAGGDDAVKAELTLAFLNNDLESFRRAMAAVKEKDYSSLYDDAAMTFGLNCGFIPLQDFGPWTGAFREFFPGKQHYFKVVYRALDKEHYDHALAMAEATARFFPEEELLVKEAEFVRSIIPGLKERKMLRSFPRL